MHLALPPARPSRLPITLDTYSEAGPNPWFTADTRTPKLALTKAKDEPLD